MTGKNAITNSSVSDDELNAILAGDSSLFDEEDQQEEVNVSEKEAEEIVQALEMDDAKAESYQAQDEKESVTPDSEETKPKAKRGPSTAGMKPSDAIRTKIGEKVYDVMAINDDHMEQAQIDTLLTAADALPKKVGEKVGNVAMHLANGVNLSVFTKTAIDLLAEKGEVTIAEIKQKYLDRPYTPGTASAQSSQMSKLLPFLGIATLDGKTLIANESSYLLPMLTKVEDEVA